jgi:hypothetical protein
VFKFPAVVIATWSAALKNIPVFVSPEFAIEGEPAEPSAMLEDQ